jgi:hypothetical protein
MDDKPHIPETVLVRVWEEQRFIPEDLKTTSGLPIQVIRRGWRNRDNGPDFKDVLVRIGDQVYEGDVELHLEAADWSAHGHDTDPNYNRTILHVVLWDSPGVQTPACPDSPLIRKANGEEVPTTTVQHSLTESLDTLLEIFQCSDDRKHQRLLSCQTHIGEIPLEHILLRLRQMGRKRLYDRAQRFEKWIFPSTIPPLGRAQGGVESPSDHCLSERGQGWIFPFQQLLYEVICEGLGYSSNKCPFVELARRLPIAVVFSHLPKQYESNSTDCLHWIQAMLFGVSGLLPPGPQPGVQNSFCDGVQPLVYDDPETDEYITELRSLWEMMLPCLDVVPMQPEEWHFFRLRPSNFPTRRIAALSYLLLNYTIQPFFENYLRFFAMFSRHPDHETQQIRLLERTLEIPAAGYWKGRYRFGKPIFSNHDRVFLGKSRIRDMLISAVFPVLLLYALRTEQTDLEAQILKLYDIFPSPRQNRLTKAISEQLFAHRDTQSLKSPLEGGRGVFLLEGGAGGCFHTASIYQGMLHLYKHYCYLPACTECPFGG